MKALIALLAAASSIAAAEATLVGDTYVRLSQPSANFGASPTLQVTGGEAFTVVQFSLDNLPPGTLSSQIARATLMVFVNRVVTPGNLNAGTYGNPWSEGTLVWANFGSFTGSASANVQQAGVFVPFDVTGAVQSWVANPAQNFGFALSTATASLFLDSKENAATSHPPRLEIILAGPQGPQGIQGIPGIPGPKGDTGAAGPSSLNGLVTLSAGTFTAFNGTAQTGLLGCPVSHPNLISGGCGYQTGADNISVTRSAIQNGTTNVWECTVRNTSGTSRTVDIQAICSK